MVTFYAGGGDVSKKDTDYGYPLNTFSLETQKELNEWKNKQLMNYKLVLAMEIENIKTISIPLSEAEKMQVSVDQAYIAGQINILLKIKQLISI
jgi:hypothetical protein